MANIVSAEFVRLPEKRPELFPGRPWVVYYFRAIRDDGKRIKQGLSSFKTKRDAARFAFSICPTANEEDLPF